MASRKSAAKKAPAKKKAAAKKAPAKKKAVAKKAPAKKKSPAKLARAVGGIQKFDDFKPYKPGRGERTVGAHAQVDQSETNGCCC